MTKTATCIFINGAGGRVGRGLVRAALDHDAYELAGGRTSSREPVDLGELAGRGKAGLETTDFRECDVVIDFSTPAGLAEALDWCMAHAKPLVSGTTGLDEDARDAMARAARTIPVLWSANMSPTVALLRRLAREAAAALGKSADVEIVEAHHRYKQDAPSGTALALGEAVAAGRAQSSEVFTLGRAGMGSARKPGEIGFASVRGGDIVGDHRVLFALEGERLELAHMATDRELFVKGALQAAAFVHGREPGLYSIEDLLD